MAGATKAARAAKALDREIERIYYANCANVEISVFDIGKIFAAGRNAAAAGTDITAAVLGTVAAVRKN
jgi:hypothetical protein